MKQLLFIFAITALFAACNTTTPPVTPEQLPVNAEAGIYGVASTSAVWPVWSVQIAWERKGPVYADRYGPTTHLMQYPTRPTPSDAVKYIPQPAYLTGTYKPLAVFNIVQVGPQQPIEQPTPKGDGLKEIPTWGK